jgi:shikimate kinase
MKELKKSKEERDRSETEQLRSLVASLYLERDRAYRKVQDFTVDSVTTERATHHMSTINTQIKKAETKLKNLLK